MELAIQLISSDQMLEMILYKIWKILTNNHYQRKLKKENSLRVWCQLSIKPSTF